ncbi:2'-5' RNA ligase [Fodinibius salinus]|uniref:RNA 2',3'-cyclic phosphodiesterase n=1 Tax=Fodinibius salinus TaxID=860790 RepID=A0A5D3YIK1_9BACT|nr:RNA 2',3'-cyclic phosphodiesterase [Fodinibius salinus]TYP92565.1 2'-5' RNA ligase [Fodinibius salinus]
MRLFIALPISESIKTQLAELKQPMDGVHWQSPDQMHLTLKFLGETKESPAQQLTDYLTNIEHPVLSLTINKLGTFPQSKKPRVLWAGIKKNDSLTTLHEKIEQLCTSLGFDPENRSFIPHITLARMKDVSKEDIAPFINQHEQFHISDILVDQFVLYESRLGSDGAIHHQLQNIKLEKH